MFNCLYEKYKVDILGARKWLAFMELELKEKILLVIIMLGSLLSCVFNLLNKYIGSYIAIGMIFIGILLRFLFRSSKREKNRRVNQIALSANKRMCKMIQLLDSFKIDISNREQLNNLIDLAKKEQKEFDAWSGFRNMFKGMTTYILLPIITIFLTEYFKGIGGKILFFRAILLVIVCSIVVLFISAFALTFNDIFNSDIRYLDFFIRDIEDIKVFSQKTGQMVDELKKSKKE